MTSINPVELGRIPMSPFLSATLSRAAEYAGAQGHIQVTVEHLLLALTEDPEATVVLKLSNIDIARLATDVSAHLGRIDERIAGGAPYEVMISPDLRRILEAAAAAASQGRRREINGAIVLAAIVGEGKTPSAHMLRAQGLTFEEAIRALQRSQQAQTAGGPAAPQLAPPSRPANTEDLLAGARERVQSRTQPPAARTAQSAPQPMQPAPLAPHVEVALQELRTQQERATAPSSDFEPDPPPATAVEAAAPRSIEPQWEPASPSLGTLASADHAPARAAPAAPETSSSPQPLEPTGPPRDLRPQPYPAPGQPAQSPPAAPPHSPPQQQWAPPPAPQAQPAPQQRPPARMPPPIPASGGPPRPLQPGGPSLPGAPLGAPPPGTAPNPALPPQTRTGPPQPAPPPWSGGEGDPRMAAGRPRGSAASDAGGYARTQPPAGQRPPAADPRQRAPAPVVQAGQLVENIPRRMRVAVPVLVEARVARAEVKAIAHGMQGGGAIHRHEVMVSKAMTVRLRAPDGGFFIETASPETQWIDNVLGVMADDYASWRWAVTPKERGKRRLQLIVSARTVGADGLMAETALPDQVIEVKVGVNYAKTAVQWGGWIAAACVGGVLARFGEDAYGLARAFIERLTSGGA